jgi:hypothetical protein
VFDDLFDGIDFSRRSGGPYRHDTIFRVAFGMLGVALSAAGAARSFTYPSAHFRLAALAVFVALGCLCLFNVTLARPWLWPLVLFALSLVALFVGRIVLGP